MTVFTPLIGRFGNQIFQYCYARKFCELHGHTLATPPWVGEKIFDIPEASRDESGLWKDGYRQAQEDMIYSRKWCQQTLRLKPHIEEKLRSFALPIGDIVAHRRVGDYAACGYPVVTADSYYRAAGKLGYEPHEIDWVTEEHPLCHPDFKCELSFVPDFYLMLRAKILFRGNSSFSFWASVLSDARTFSPCIKGKIGGVESDCEFTEGNHERFCELEFVQDLHMFNNNDLYEWPLNEKSLVLDVGGYDGDFAAEMFKRYGCSVVIFEPWTEKYLALCARFKESKNGRPLLLQQALGSRTEPCEIKIKGSMTGAFADGPSQLCVRRDIKELMEHFPEIDLLKLNCEGSEFEILERVLECGLAPHIKAICVQFHGVVSDAQKRYGAIREGLLRTHRPTFYEPWCWEGFELRK